jgi:hypothetical protein
MSDLITPPAQPHVCKSCGNQFTGFFCNICGEKVILPRERTFKTILNGILMALINTDSKFLKTLWYMVRKPGFVSREFANGRTVKYLKPASAFFILNLFYFFFPVIQLFNASLKTQLNAPHGRLIKEILARKIAHMGMNLDSFAFIYNIKTVSLAKMMVMVFVFLAALPLNLLYAKRNRFFNDHLHYTTELATFNLLVNALGLTIVVSTLGLGKYLNEEVFTGIFITTNLYFVIRSGIVFYNEKGWLLIVKSALIILSLIVALEVYRFILFFVTLYMLN